MNRPEKHHCQNQEFCYILIPAFVIYVYPCPSRQNHKFHSMRFEWSVSAVMLLLVKYVTLMHDH